MVCKKFSVILFICLVILCNFLNCRVSASEISDIQTKQKELGFLKDEDLANLVFFSDYDMYFDRNLYYNPTARNIVNRINTAEEHWQKANVSVSFYEYRNTIKDMPQNDFYYMTMAYKLASIGFFSLAHSAMMKVQDKEIWEYHIDFLRQHCFPKTNLKVTEEVFFAGLLSDIVYNNMTDESLIKLEKNGQSLTDYDYAKYIRAQAYFAEKNYKEALVQINKAIFDNPNNIFYKKLKAEILSAADKEKEALSIVHQLENTDIIFTDIKKDIDKIKYHALSKVDKNETTQKYCLAYYFYLNRDYQRAINELKLLMMKGNNNQAAELLGKIYEITNMQDEAEKMYLKQIAKNKNCAFAHKGLGDIYLANGNYAGAYKEYQIAYKSNKNDLETLVGLTVAANKTNDGQNAKKYATKLLKANKTNYKALYINSKINTDKGNLNLKASISQNPLYSGGWLDLAQQALYSNDIVSAEEYINTAAYITKKDARYFYYKSILNTEKKDYKTAQTDINRAGQIVKERNGVKNGQI